MNIGKFAQSLKKMFSRNEYRKPTAEPELFIPRPPQTVSKRRQDVMLEWLRRFNFRTEHTVLEKSPESIYLKAHKNPRRRKARRTKPVRVLTGQPGGNAHDRRIERRKGVTHGKASAASA